MRRLDLDDMTRLKHIAEAEISPDGKWAAAVVHSFLTDCNAVTRQVLVTALDTEDRRLVSATDEPAKDSSVAWSPDAKYLAYVTAKASGDSLNVYDVAAGQTREVLPSTPGLAAPRWSPDGGRIAFLAYGPPRRGQTREPVSVAQAPAARLDWRNGPPEISNVVERGTGWRHKVWIFDTQTGQAEQLTEGEEDHGNPFFGGDLAWSPDGTTLVYAADRLSDWRTSYHRRALYALDIASRAERRLTPATGHAVRPAFSPDGRQLAYLGTRTADLPELSALDLFVVDLESGEIHCLSEPLDRPVGAGQGGDPDRGPVWSADGIATTLCDRGAVNLVRFGFDGSLTPITAVPQVCQSVSGDKTGKRLLAVRSDFTHFADLCVYEDGRERVVLEPNRALLDELEVGTPTSFYIRRAGEDLDYWLLMPAESGAGRVPVILDIHGGPSSQFSATLYYEHQVWSNRGYAVVYGNPRGSHGYSDRFLRGPVGDFGGEDLQDVFAMLDDALAREPRLDGDRVGVTGYSYGGYMTNRAITLTPRFRAAVSGSGPTNLVSMAGSSDLGRYLSTIYQQGPVQAQLGHYIERSPVFAAHRVRTPLLMYHGSDDPRVRATQAEEYLYELCGYGVEAKALLLPGETHQMIRRIGVGTGSPVHQRAIREATLDWFDRHLRSAADA